MSSALDVQLAAAENAGYELILRHQPAILAVEPENWVFLIKTPDGRLLYPPQLDDCEADARVHAAVRIAQDMAEQARGGAST